MANDKRVRKKEARDRQAAEREAALRRRRTTRLALLGFIVLAVVGIALASGRQDVEPNPQPASEGTEAAAACGAEPPPPADPQQYDAPEDVLEEGVDYAAIMHTSCGEIEFDLLEDKAPRTVNSFVFLAREGFYDGLTFHRIVGNFVIQGGDPDGQGDQEPNGPGYTVPDEFPEKGNEYVFGTVAMANSGPGTTGSQFFIVTHLGANDRIEPAGLDPLYTIFGEVAEGSYDTVKEIAKQDVKAGTDPAEAEEPVVPVYIESVEIIER